MTTSESPHPAADGRDRSRIRLLRDPEPDPPGLSDEAPPPGDFADDGIVGDSPALREVMESVRRVAPSGAPVLLTGESGTGKELFARAVHRRSLRCRGPLVAVNCAAIPSELLESKLFGHEKGAFTGAVGSHRGHFEVASGGTLFLDEIGEMDFAVQAKILRALESGEVTRVGAERPTAVDVRIVAASNRDLAAAVDASRFRPDLYYRLAVVELALPPLRDRGADFEHLLRHFLDRYGRAYDRPVRRITDEARYLLAVHEWPGNVRELQNAVERAVLLMPDDVLGVAQLPPAVRGASPHEGRPGADGGELPPLAEVERRHVLAVLASTGGELARTAEILGIHRNTLRNKLNRYEVDARSGASAME